MSPTLPTGWRQANLADVVELQRGFDLPAHARRPGPYPVLTSGEGGGWHDQGPVPGPGFVVGRATNLGKPKWSEGAFWPHNTTMFAKDFKGNDPRWLFHLFETTDLSGFDSGSVQPMLNRNYIARVKVAVPPLSEQRAIAEVLGALDDKIAANTALAEQAEKLAALTYDLVVTSWPRVPMSSLLDPILGGTPLRARDDYWTGGDQLWISARDVTSAPSRVVLDTAEKITRAAVAGTKAKPLPAGSVILTARGTVGQVGRLARPASFNQSCYGFRPDVVPPGLLYYSILRATERARAVAHGSVFDTISKATFDHLELAWDAIEAPDAESQVAPILDVVVASIEENRTLAATRDALLPQLMSGKLRVRDAERIASEAGA